MKFFELLRWGDAGWGDEMAAATLMTVGVAAVAFVLGLGVGTAGAWAKLSGSRVARGLAEAYTTVVRGVPDLLVIYLFYFGGSAALTAIGQAFGAEGFIGINAFFTGAAAVGVVSGAYQTEVLRGGYLAIARGELEAARSVGMSPGVMLRRIVAPQTARYALPGMGNVWQLALKESALVSVTGLAELLRQAHVGAGSTRQPFTFYITAATLYLVLTTASGWLFRRAEVRTMRGVRRG